MPLDHAKLPVSDLDATRAFYTAALVPLGWRLVWDEAPTLGFGRGDGGEDDEPLAFQLSNRPISATHLALTAESTEQVEAFHAAAVVAGGRDNGPPVSVRTAAATTPPSSSIRTGTTSRSSFTATARDARLSAVPGIRILYCPT